MLAGRSFDGNGKHIALEFSRYRILDRLHVHVIIPRFREVEHVFICMREPVSDVRVIARVWLVPDQFLAKEPTLLFLHLDGQSLREEHLLLGLEPIHAKRLGPIAWDLALVRYVLVRDSLVIPVLR